MGSNFGVEVHVTSPPPDGYYAFQSKLRWAAGVLDYHPAPASADEVLWPECTIPARIVNSPAEPSVLLGCVPLPTLPVGSTFTGAVLQFELTCLAPGPAALTLVPRQGDPQNGTHFFDASGHPMDPSLVGAGVTCIEDKDGDGIGDGEDNCPNTPNSGQIDSDQDGLGNACDDDDDSDGCSDGQELGSNPALGGQRNPKHFWDFFDTPSSGNIRDQVIDIGDLFRVVDHFGTFGDANIDPLSTPPASGYHTGYDRSPPGPGADPWDLGPPDGTIDSSDIIFAVNQFGHSCL